MALTPDQIRERDRTRRAAGAPPADSLPPVPIVPYGLADALFHQSGPAEIGVSDAWPAPGQASRATFRLRCRSAPVGSALSIDFKLNGTVVQTLTIPAGSVAPQEQSRPLNIVPGDALTVETTSVGSTTPAAGAVAQVVVT